VQQEILEKYPSSDLRVYAVWFNMLPRDSRGGQLANILSDARVTQFWDAEQLAGKAYAPLVDYPGVLWDAYFLYGPETRWDDSSAPPPKAVGYGRTIFNTREKLKEEFDRMVAR
jgi:hypothetical protein